MQDGGCCCWGLERGRAPGRREEVEEGPAKGSQGRSGGRGTGDGGRWTVVPGAQCRVGAQQAPLLVPTGLVGRTLNLRGRRCVISTGE